MDEVERFSPYFHNVARNFDGVCAKGHTGCPKAFHDKLRKAAKCEPRGKVYARVSVLDYVGRLQMRIGRNPEVTIV